jgi:hypothetical protein
MQFDRYVTQCFTLCDRNVNRIQSSFCCSALLLYTSIIENIYNYCKKMNTAVDLYEQLNYLRGGGGENI